MRDSEASVSVVTVATGPAVQLSTAPTEPGDDAAVMTMEVGFPPEHVTPALRGSGRRQADSPARVKGRV